VPGAIINTHKAMCIIIDNADKKTIAEAIIERSASINKDGYGRIDLRTGKVIRTLNINEAKRLCAERIPAVHHFRYATVGGKGIDNVHPFELRGGWWMMQNGTVSGLVTRKGESDTACLARMLADNVHHDNYANALSIYDSRFILAHPEHGTLRIGKWHEHNGIYYSKDNVLPEETELLAVYGTLRKGYHNHRLMHGSKHIGNGFTAERHRMHGESIPFVLEGDEAGVGGNVRVEVYEVAATALKGAIDSLEGHPKVYTRRKTHVVLDEGRTIECWLYFYDHAPLPNTVFYTDYSLRRAHRVVQNTPKYSTWNLFRKATPKPPCPTCDTALADYDDWWYCESCHHARVK
jgi:gamma-glutamylaminecyclotransferase